MTETRSTTVDRLWDAASKHFPAFSPELQRVGLSLLNELLGGEPVSAARLAAVLNVKQEEAERYLNETSLNPFVHPANAAPVEAFWGVTTFPTPHQFTVNGRTLWTSCAVDALFLPELLDVTAQIESKDPESGDPVSLTVSPKAVEIVDPEDVMVSMSSPEAWDSTSALHLMLTACHTTHFFASPETGTRWVSSHPNTALLTLDDAVEYGRRQNKETFGSQLAARRATGR